MATIRLDTGFDVDAPPDRVWAYLSDPARVVVCLPGATLEEQTGERSYRGTVVVSVGPVTVTYRGTADLAEVDDGARRLVMKASGREKSGSGQARMTMESRVEALDGGRSRVVADAEVEVGGKIVRFGRGMIQRVSDELFLEFGRCLEELAQGGGQGAGGGEASAPAAEGAAASSPPSSAGGDAVPRKANGLVLAWRALRRWLAELTGRREGH